MPHIDLLELPYFSGIRLDDVVSFVDLMHPGQFRAGEFIVREGSPKIPPLYIATTGRVLISKRGPEGHERELAELRSPTLFGEIELFCQITPVTSVQAIDRVSTFCITRDEFDALYVARHPAIVAFTFNVARVACHRLAVADEMLAYVLAEEDLVTMRRTIFSRMAEGKNWLTTTGMFVKPSRESAPVLESESGSESEGRVTVK